MPMRLIARILDEHLDVVTSAIQEVRDSVLLQISYWTTSDNEDPIEVIEMHEVTWNVMRSIYIENLDASKCLLLALLQSYAFHARFYAIPQSIVLMKC